MTSGKTSKSAIHVASLIELSKNPGVDDVRSFEIREIPALYVPDPNLLVQAADVSDHIAFHRITPGSSVKRSRDIFAIGPGKTHEHPWPASGGAFDWQGSREGLKELENCNGILMGYIAYEAGFAFEPHKWTQLPTGSTGYAWRFMEFSCWYECDHDRKSARICLTDNATSTERKALEDIISAAGNTSSTALQSSAPCAIDEVAALGELSRDEYENVVSNILEDIGAGRFYELNFTQRYHCSTATSPKSVFENLFRTLFPSRGFFANIGDEVVVSASPELFLHKSGDRIITRPIKGSMTGMATADQMGKINAEHIMVVDLARNDIGRISDRDWVSVEELGTVQSFGNLRHMESLIAGVTSLQWHDVLAGTFPAASITGTPKVMVVQAIAEYEKSARNVYTGSCGCLFPNGDIDLNVAIRSLSARPDPCGWHYEFGAGGAITADSDPGAEYMECLLKAQPLVQALRLNKVAR